MAFLAYLKLTMNLRNTLYPKLQDHDLVLKERPNVRGVGQNIFFLSHEHKENSGEDSSLSKYNQYEVRLLSLFPTVMG